MKKMYAVVLAISMAVVWAGGCQEEQASSGDKAVRLAAVENRELQSQLQAEKKKSDDEIKKLNQQLKIAQTPLKAEIAKRDEEIKKLGERNQEQLKNAQASTQAEISKRDDQIKELSAKLQAEMTKGDEDVRSIRSQLDQCAHSQDERVAKEIDKQCQETVSSLMDWTAKLTAEIEKLKAGQADVNEGTGK